MRKLNEITESLKIWYNSQDELSKDLINYILIATAALIIAFAFGFAFYILKIPL